MKAILLIRVSTSKQDIEQQTEKVKNEAMKDGYTADNLILIEDHESAVRLNEEERNGLNRMKAAIEKGDVECVYSWEISRISRKAGIVYSIRDYLISKGVQLVILNPYFRLLKEDGTLSETSNLFFGIFGSMAENEGYLRKERVMRGKAKKRAEGRITSGKPLYGYSIDKDKRPYVNENEAVIVKEIYRRWNEGQSEGIIGREMWERGVFGSIRQNSCISRVSKILKDERYRGGDLYPAIIEKTNNYSFSSHKYSFFEKKIRTTDDVHLLAGLIYTEDGYRLTPSPANGRYSKMNDRQAVNLSVNMKAADEAARRAIAKHIPYMIEDPTGRINELKTGISDLHRKITAADDKIAGWKKENNRINERIIKGRMDEDKGDSMIDTNIKLMEKAEDDKISWNNMILAAENEIIVLSNPLLNEPDSPNGDMKHDRELLKRLCIKIICKKLGVGRYEMDFLWTDGTHNIMEVHSGRAGFNIIEK